MENPMTIKDIATRIGDALAIPPNVYSATTTPSPIDTAGFHSAALLIGVGIGGITFTPTNRIDFVLQESDDGVNFSPVTAAELTGPGAPGSVSDGIVLSLTAAHAAATLTRIGYIGGKRYLELTAQFGGTHASGTPISAAAVLGNPEIMPTS
jgi:hypothetical protein